MPFKRPSQNFLIDAASLVAFVLMAASGFLMRYTLPPGSGRGAVVFGLDRHEWGALHFWFSVVLMALLAIHLLLHWKWIVAMVRGKKPEKSGYRLALGLVGVAGLAFLLVSPFLVPVERRADAGGHETVRADTPGIETLQPGDPTSPAGRGTAITPPASAQDAHGEHEIRGRMTLAEVSGTTGVPLDYLRENLGLPPSVPETETLGRLQERFGFTMADARSVCAAYREP
jgi:hypothetical protein